MTPEPRNEAAERSPCSQCGQMMIPPYRHTYEDCQKWRAALAAERAAGIDEPFLLSAIQPREPGPAVTWEFFKNTTRTEPTTAAGRELVEEEPRLIHGEHSMLRRVLAIEAEAAERAAPKVDAQTADLLAALAELNIYSRGDLDLRPPRREGAAMTPEPRNKAADELRDMYRKYAHDLSYMASEVREAIILGEAALAAERAAPKVPSDMYDHLAAMHHIAHGDTCNLCRIRLAGEADG